jgi:hypothetical protein
MGGLPGMPGLLTSYLERKMDKLDIRPIPEYRDDRRYRGLALRLPGLLRPVRAQR